MELTANTTFEGIMYAAADAQPEMSFTEEMMLRVCLLRPLKRRKLQQAISERVRTLGLLPPTAVFDSNGIYTGPWLDLFDWIKNNWEWIFSVIQALLILF